jgi:hypothetical protein
MMRHLNRSLAIAAAASLAGCFATQILRPDAVSQLDGFGEIPSPSANAKPGPDQASARLEDEDGEPVRFTSDSELLLKLNDDRVVRDRYTSIHVRDGLFEGKSADGQLRSLPVTSIQRAEVSTGSTKKTLIVVGLIILSAALAVGAGIAIAPSRPTILPPCGCGCGGIRCGRPLRINGTLVAASSVSSRQGCEPRQSGDCFVGPMGLLAMTEAIPHSLFAMTPSRQWSIDGPAPSIQGLSEDARRWLAAAWLEDATHEHAGVAAFSRLSLVLMGLGAADDLIEATHVAARQEVDHTRRLFALASAYAGEPLGPGPLPALLSSPPTTRGASPGDALTEVAEETLIDGCLNEGVVALMATDALETTTDPVVRGTLEVIVRDEIVHAELAWKVLAWCADVGGPALRRRLARSVEALPNHADAKPLPAPLAGELQAHGRVDAVAVCRRFMEVRETVRTRALTLLRELPDRSSSEIRS